MIKFNRDKIRRIVDVALKPLKKPLRAPISDRLTLLQGRLSSQWSKERKF